MSAEQAELDLGLAPRATEKKNASDVGLFKGTLDAYDADFKHFEKWCEDHARRALPATPSTVAEYVIDLSLTSPQRPVRNSSKPRRAPSKKTVAANHSYATIRRRLYGIAHRHERDQFTDPTKDDVVYRALQRIAVEGRRRDSQPTVPAQTAQLEQILKAMEQADLDSVGMALRKLRDRAVFLTLYSGALTREEARTLTVEQLGFLPEGITVAVNGTSRRRREVRPAPVLLQGLRPLTDPVGALAEWMRMSGITAGPLFVSVSDSGILGTAALSKAHFARLFSRRVKAAGLDPRRVTPQSLRVGYVLETASKGASLQAIVAHTGHLDTKNVIEIFRQGQRFAEHPSRLLGL